MTPTCPRCGADEYDSESPRYIEWICTSYRIEENFFQQPTCRVLELEAGVRGLVEKWTAPKAIAPYGFDHAAELVRGECAAELAAILEGKRDD